MAVISNQQNEISVRQNETDEAADAGGDDLPADDVHHRVLRDELRLAHRHISPFWAFAVYGVGGLAVSLLALYLYLRRGEPDLSGRRVVPIVEPGLADLRRRSIRAARAPHHARTMATRPPQIVAFGGGGFSMEAGNPLLDDYVLVAHRRRAAEGLLRADRLRRRGPLRRALLPHVRDALRRLHVSLFRRDRGAAAVEGDLEAHLLAQDVIYVGGGSVVSLLGAWRAHGLDRVLQQRVAARRRAVRPVGRLAVLVRGGGDRVPRRADASCAGSGCCRTPTASTTTASRSGARSTAASSATACGPATRPTTARRCTSSGAELAASSARARARGRTASSRSTARWSRRRCRSATSAREPTLAVA